VRTIAVINQKGGCGKTTVSINLAAVLAQHGRRTLLVDVDPQSHCALGLAVPDSQIEKHTGDLLRHGLDGSVAPADIVWQVARHLDLAPSGISLAAIEQELAGAPDRDRRLTQVLSTVQDRYEFCIIDCPPSIGLLTFNALRAADEVIIPVETGYFSMQGAVKQQATIDLLARRVNHHARFKVLATMYDVRTKLAREILGELKRQFGERLLPVVINFNSKLKEAASFGQPITEYDPASRGMQDFERLCQWLLDNPPHAPVGSSQEGGAEPFQPASPMSPAMSRAAELVERARALSTRTAALSDRLTRDTDAKAEQEAGTTEFTPSTPAHAASPDAGSPANATGPDRAADRTRDHPTLTKAAADTPAPPTLAEKLQAFYGVRQTNQGVLFVQPGDQGAQLAIAGDFNQWQPEQTPLQRNDKLGIWEACINVPPGRYHYRLVVDGQWQNDPYNKQTETNPFGELNNIVEVPGEAQRQPARSTG